MGKYKHLQDYLNKQKQNGVSLIKLSFGQIEQLLKDNLPNSAREHRTWWANTHPVVFPKPWTKIGWKTCNVDMNAGQVCFRYSPMNPLQGTQTSPNISKEKMYGSLERHGPKTISSSSSKLSLNKTVFEYICHIHPEMKNGHVQTYYPQSGYANSRGLSLHRYGHGPFCRFQIPRSFAGKGVYSLAVNRKVMYIGECQNLSDRFNNGYGTIHPRNCYAGGQPTNCRINNLIFEECSKGSDVVLYFIESKNRKDLEKMLIAKYSPDWNLQM